MRVSRDIRLEAGEVTLLPVFQCSARDFHQLCSDNSEHIQEFFPTLLRNNSSNLGTRLWFLQKKKNWSAGTSFAFGILFRGQLCGFIGVMSFDPRVPRAELGYFIERNMQRKGITRDAIRLMCAWCFGTLKCSKVIARISPENEHSRNLVLQLGFEYEGTLKNDFRNGFNRLIDVEYYALYGNQV